ncbi:zinc finger CCCH domain-containing protein 34-like isoform X2 [Rhodamnia argentea]|uniref:Zinc finger CCCH domain-containing protein 34-like isoform X2 n=1 Tax=Rhodamnia argentea TaxID=178133 RepID=A0ABM3HBE3_9MYRT|nr:zinc finger CCCH domain-containing protein 34-like isoform X2 [Rhodamnia argentea]
MSEGTQKRNTDCVFYLASPLTCKKGLDCEYRHNEIARLNPKDCWYWLAGNCLNPTCGFRHPPLDKLSEVSSELHMPPANKISTPCYFYYNGFCNKGDSCTYSHGSDCGRCAAVSSKEILKVNNAPFLDKKASTGDGHDANLSSCKESRMTKVTPSEWRITDRDDSASAPLEEHLNLSGTSPAAGNLSCLYKEEIQNVLIQERLQLNDSPQDSVSECEEDAETGSEYMPTAEGLTQSRSHRYPDYGSEGQVEDHVVREGYWESHILVNGGSKSLAVQGNQKCFLELDPQYRHFDSHVSDYDLGVSSEHEPMYSDAENLCEYETYDSDNDSHFDRSSNDVRSLSVRFRETASDVMFSREREMPRVELTHDDRHDLDLCRPLRENNTIGSFSRIPRRHGSFHLGVHRQERLVLGRRMQGRLALVGKNAIESFRDKEKFPDGFRRHGWVRHREMVKFRAHCKEKRLPKWSTQTTKASRKPLSRWRQSAVDSASFSSPKTLAQIKEDKRRAKEIRVLSDVLCIAVILRLLQKMNENPFPIFW